MNAHLLQRCDVYVVLVQHHHARVQCQTPAKRLDRPRKVAKAGRALRRTQHHHSVHAVATTQPVAQPIQRSCALYVLLKPRPAHTPHTLSVDIVRQDTPKNAQQVARVRLHLGHRRYFGRWHAAQ